MKKYILTLLSVLALSSHAEMPNKDLLNDLKNYTNKTVDCEQFSCNSINQIKIDYSNNQFTSSLDVSSRKSSFVSLPFNSEEVKLDSVLLDNKIWYQIVKDVDYKIVVPEGTHTLSIKFHLNNDFLSLTQKIPNLIVSDSLTLEDKNGSSVISVKDQNQKKTSKNDSSSDKDNYPTQPFYQITRTLYLSSSWKLVTVITPLFDVNKSTSLEIPLLKGEKVLNSDLKIDDSNAYVTLTNKPITWESTIPTVDKLDIPSVQSNSFTQVFSLESSNLWNYSVNGKNPFSINGDITSWALWSGESLKLAFNAPKVLIGKTLSLSNLSISLKKEHDDYIYSYQLSAKTTLAEKTFFTLPDNFKILSLNINNQPVNIDKNTKKIPVDLIVGHNDIFFTISTSENKSLFKSFPYVEFNEPIYNADYKLVSDNWILYSGGADINTDYIIISSLCFLFILTILSVKISPNLKFISVAFILFGFLQGSVLDMCLFPTLLGLLKVKDFIINRYENNKNRREYNTFQFILIFISIVFFISFLITLKVGLLDSPRTWTNYNTYTISWFNELYSNKTLWYVEIDSVYYHIIMFIWAIFVSYNLINISKMIFKAIFNYDLWIKKSEIIQPKFINQEQD